ncbi:MAG: hypothetical protein IJU90_09140 [Bacteroidales bacterium]|nr:hypothetical protein [Bacteroidales bacterium]
MEERNLIIEQLDGFIRKYYKNRVIRGSLWAAAVLLGLFIVLLAAEGLGWFSPVVRGLLFWGFVLVAVGLTAWLVALPLMKMYRLGSRISYEQAARIIGEHFPEVKDKLLNLLQLQKMMEGDGSQSGTSYDGGEYELLRAGIAQKTAQLSPVPFKQAVNLAANKKYVKYAAVPLGLIVLTLIVAPRLVTEPSKRIANYNTTYERPAPFRFVVESERLEVAQQEDFLLRVAVEGEALPAEAYVMMDGRRYKMQQQDKSHFTYLFKQQGRSVDFRLTAAGVTSGEYALQVFPKPAVVDFQVALSYPAYTRQQAATLSNQGDMSVSQGTLIKWLFLTKDVDTLRFVVDGRPMAYVPDRNGRVAVQVRAMESFGYSFYVANERARNSDTLRYAVSVVPDVAPMIAVMETADSSLPDRRFFHGRIKDDYGFSRLEMVVIKSNATDTTVHERMSYPVALTKEVSQEFLYAFNMAEISLSPGDRLQYYFEVWDNDAIHGPKSATSQQFLMEVPTERELSQILDKNSAEAVESAERSMSELKKLQEEINELMRRLVDKKELGWQEKKQLQELAERQKEVREELQKMQQQLQENNQLEEKYREQNDQIREKQEELDRLMNEVMNDEMKEMMEQIDKLLQEMDKNKVQEQLENLKLDNEQLEKQIDQNIELMKRLEMEKKVDNAVRQMDELAKKQEELAKETEALDKAKLSKEEAAKKQEELQKRQEQLSQEFQEQKKEIEQIQKDYKEIDKNLDFKVDKELEKKIEQNQQEAQQQMEKKKNKQASKKQQEAAEEMQQMSEQLAAEQMRMEQEDLAEDSDMIRRLLKSLVQLSKDQESLIDQANKTYIQDPRYQEIIASQNKIKDDFRNVEDSLSAIAKRQVSVASAITREVGNVNSNVQRSLSSLLRFNQSFYGNAHNTGAAQPMQYGMTALNNLSLLLAESLDDMQNQMRQNAMQQKAGNCKRNCKQQQSGNSKNPNSKKPSAKSMKQMQEQLNKQLEALKKQLDQQGKNQQQGSGRHKIGQSGQMSEEFSKMAAQQEMIRRMMQQYGQEMKQHAAGNAQMAKEIDEMMRQMEQTETDLVNKTITQQTIKRQQQIMTRLLEHEKAEMQREKEERRQSREASEQYQPSPADIEKYEQLKRSNQELFRTTPPSLTPYYKKKVSEYFYGL